MYVNWLNTEIPALDEKNLINVPITSINISAADGIYDFTIYGIGFGCALSKIYTDFGIPDDVYENSISGEMELCYYGIDTQKIKFKLTNKKLTEIYISR